MANGPGGKFEKGCPPGPGRPPGTPTAKRLLAATAVLAEAGRHPILELVKIADEEKDAGKRWDRWMTIIAYCEAPVPPRTAASSPEESRERAAAIAAELAAASKPSEPAPAANATPGT